MALSGLDMALWDLRGRALGRPVVECWAVRAVGVRRRPRPPRRPRPLRSALRSCHSRPSAPHRSVIAHPWPCQRAARTMPARPARRAVVPSPTSSPPQWRRSLTRSACSPRRRRRTPSPERPAHRVGPSGAAGCETRYESNAGPVDPGRPFADTRAAAPTPGVWRRQAPPYPLPAAVPRAGRGRWSRRGLSANGGCHRLGGHAAPFRPSGGLRHRATASAPAPGRRASGVPRGPPRGRPCPVPAAQPEDRLPTCRIPFRVGGREPCIAAPAPGRRPSCRTPR